MIDIINSASNDLKKTIEIVNNNDVESLKTLN